MGKAGMEEGSMGYAESLGRAGGIVPRRRRGGKPDLGTLGATQSHEARYLPTSEITSLP